MRTTNGKIEAIDFTAGRYRSAVYDMVILNVCPSVYRTHEFDVETVEYIAVSRQAS